MLDDRRVGHDELARHLRGLGFRVAVATPDVRAFFKALDGRVPALAVVDVSHESGDRVGAIGELGRLFPALRTLAVVGGSKRSTVERCLALGAWRCVPRPVASTRAIAKVIHAGANGRNHSEPFSATAGALTPKEREILGHIAVGADNLKISAALGVTERTVKSHITRIYRKLGAQNRVELALIARGLIAG